MDINKEWEAGRYDQVLKLLQNDSHFPKEFTMKNLNREDEDQRELIEFVEKRNQLHQWIEDGNEEEVKNFTKENKSRYYFKYFDGDDISAASTALEFRRFKIYAYLLSIGARLDPDELDEIDHLEENEKDDLQDILLCHFPTFKDSHLLYLASKLKFDCLVNQPQDFVDSLILSLKKLNENENVSIILKVIQYIDNLNIVLSTNSDNVFSISPFASESDRGITFRHLRTIYVASGGERLPDEALGTLAHELTHMAMYFVFKNDCKPYQESDNENKTKFTVLTKEVEENLRNEIGKPREILANAFIPFYKNRKEEQSELIVRVPQILINCPDDGQDWLNENFPSLLQFYRETLIPILDKFIEQRYLSQPRSLVRSLNEVEGEIITIKKNHLFFENIQNFKSIQNMKKFLDARNKNIFVLITKQTRLGILKILQGMYGVDYLEFYDKFLILKSENLTENLGELKYLFYSEATEALIVECTDIINIETFKEITKIVKEKKNKKILLVIKEKENEGLKKVIKQLKLNDLLIQEIDDEISVLDLDIESKNKILAKKVLFLGKELLLKDLVGDNECLLKFVNGEVIKNIQRDEKIEIGSKPFGTSDLEGAYADVLHELDKNSFVNEVFTQNNIYLIYVESDSLQSRLVPFFDNFECEVPDNEKVLYIPEDMNDDSFKIFSNYNSGRKIYLITVKNHEENFKFTLVKIYNPDFYYERNFIYYSKTIIKKEIFKINIPDDVKIIVITDENNKLNEKKRSFFGFEVKIKNVDFLDPKSAENKFDDYKKSNKISHLLKYEKGDLIWVKSNGSLAFLRDFIDKISGEEKEIGEKELVEKILKEQVVILADGPGMGKSCSITKLNEDSLIKNSHWIIRINLKDHLKAIDNYLNKEINIEEVANFLKETDLNLKSEFCKNLLKFALRETFHKKLLIVFDGFDELLDKKSREKMLKLLKFLKENTKCKILIATRLQCKEMLENELSIFSIKFVPIDDNSNKNYVKHFLKYRVKLLINQELFSDLFENEQNLTLDQYAIGFLNKIDKIFQNSEKFIGTPLRLHLLLERSIESFINYAKGPDKNFNYSFLGNNLNEIYKYFFGRKYEIFFKKKNYTEETLKNFMKDSFEKDHEELAKILILNDKKISDDVKYHESLILLIGILKSIDKNIEFNHLTFRDFYFWQLLNKHLLKENYHVMINDFPEVVKKILIGSPFHLIRCFIDEHLLKKENWEFLLTLQEFKNLKFWDKKGKEICGFCYAVQEKHNALLRFLFKVYSVYSNIDELSILLHKKLCSQKIIHLAIRKRNKDAFNLLIEKSTSDKYDHAQIFEIFSDVNNHHKTILHVAAEKKNVDFVFDVIIEKSSEFISDQQLELLSIKDEDGQTVLHSAVNYANKKAWRQILGLLNSKNSKEIPKFSKTQKYEFLRMVNNFGESVLHLAVENKRNKALYEILNFAEIFTSNEKYDFLCILDITGETAFHLAITERNNYALEKIIKFIKNLDSDEKIINFLKITNKKQETFFHYAINYNNCSAFDKIMGMTSTPDFSIKLARGYDQLLSAAFDPKIFQLAREKNSPETLDFLFEKAKENLKPEKYEQIERTERILNSLRLHR